MSAELDTRKPQQKSADTKRMLYDEYPGGRGTLYKKEHCETAMRLGADGASRAEIAETIGVHRDTLHEWEDRHPEFSDAMKRAKQAEQVWWERKGRVGMEADKFNSAVWAKNMNCRFPKDWRDVQAVDLTVKRHEDALSEIEAAVTVVKKADGDAL